MSCKLSKCSDKIKTEDGFCCKHAYYSSVDEKEIVLHIRKYLDELNNLSCKKKKIKIMINLWYYMTHKKDFILKNNQFYNTILKKAVEINESLTEDKYIKALEKFNSLHQQITNFKN